MERHRASRIAQTRSHPSLHSSIARRTLPRPFPHGCARLQPCQALPRLQRRQTRDQCRRSRLGEPQRLHPCRLVGALPPPPAGAGTLGRRPSSPTSPQQAGSGSWPPRPHTARTTPLHGLMQRSQRLPTAGASCSLAAAACSWPAHNCLPASLPPPLAQQQQRQPPAVAATGNLPT